MSAQIMNNNKCTFSQPLFGLVKPFLSTIYSLNPNPLRWYHPGTPTYNDTRLLHATRAVVDAWLISAATRVGVTALPGGE
jgi:hypothetical protein